MPDAPSPITSPPAVPGQPYDATSESAAGKWDCLESVAGEVGFEGGQAGDHFAGADRHAQGQSGGQWKQT
jgi:hypothetical protein